MSRIELHIRGVPVWLLRAYLAELGAAATVTTTTMAQPPA